MCWNRIKALVHKWQVAKWLRAVRRWMANWDALNKNRALLSPKILSPNSSDDNEKFRYAAVDELRNAIDSDRCNNIAITGVYGSGKSSIIQTYLAEQNYFFRSRKVLSISLSNFIDVDSLKTYGAPTRYENEIEQKIFQHILHKTNQNKTRQTRYGRISHISIPHGIWRAFTILLSVLSLIILFVPIEVWPINIESWFKSLDPCVQETFEWCALIYLCIFFVCGVEYLIRRAHLFKFHGKINASKLELEWHSESSKIDKLLDEILYFFKAGGYKIVIFEDLDRIKNPERLFLKLREINILLNESDYYKRWNRSIKFIYAIRDEVFDSDIRTKCFDYIIPVIPVVDKYNAVDYLLSKYHKSILAKIEEADLSLMGMFIDSKRELSNIINEYATYHEAFTHLSGSEKKLLAILVYKNAFPEDYAAAYSGQGCLASVFDRDNKEQFYKPLIKEHEDAADTYEKIITQHRGIIQSCRRKVTTILAQEGISKLIIGGREYKLSEFETNDRLYEMLVHDKIGKYIIINGRDYSEPIYDKKFADLLKQAYPSGVSEYEEVMQNAEESLGININGRDKELREIEIIKNQKLSTLLDNLDFEKSRGIINGICTNVYKERYKNITPKEQDIMEKNLNILLIFAIEELIEDDYASYMSHTYPGALTERDARFVNSVYQGISLGSSYELENVDAVVRKLRSADYTNESVLNVYLVDHLMEVNNTTNLNLLIKAARKYPLFVVEYSKREKYGKQFAEKVIKGWENALYYIIKIEDEDVRTAMCRMYIDVAPCEERLMDSWKAFLGTMYKLFAQSVIECDNIKAIKNFIRYHEIKFSALSADKDYATQLFEFVIRGGYFEINFTNLSIIYGEAFNKASFTQIYAGDSDVMKYLLQNAEVLLTCLPESSTEETPETLISILNNQTFQSMQFDEYISMQTNKIDLEKMQYDERVPLLLKTDLIHPTWENVGNSIVRITEMDPLLEFVKSHVEELKESKCETKNVVEIESLLSLTDSLSDDEFSKLVKCFTEPLEYVSVKDLSEYRLRLLNIEDMLCYDDETIKLMASKSVELFSEYLMMNFEYFIEDDEVPVKITNAIGIEMLKSPLTIEQKKQFVEKYPFDPNEEKANEYAPVYCEFCEQNGVMTNLKALIAAMKTYPAPKDDGESWRIHISLVNQINRVHPYNRELEAQLVSTIGEHYENLNILYNREKEFDINHENEELLEYLKVNKHYVSNVSKTDKGKFYVTFRHKL